MHKNNDYPSWSDETFRTIENTNRGFKGLYHIIKGFWSSENFINHSYFLSTCLDFLGKIAYCSKKEIA